MKTPTTLNFRDQQLTRFRIMAEDLREKKVHENPLFADLLMIAGVMNLLTPEFKDHEIIKLMRYKFLISQDKAQELLTTARQFKELADKSNQTSGFGYSPGSKVEISPDINNKRTWTPGIVYELQNSMLKVLESRTGRVFNANFNQVRPISRISH
jgi:hypothetical protein